MLRRTMAHQIFAVVSAFLIINGVSLAIDCPDSCNCYKAPDSLIEANCTSLDKLHKFLSSKKSLSFDVLKIKDPFITSINGQIDKLSSLSVLDLSGNNLNNIKKLPKSIVKLDLSNNFLKSIDELPQSLKELNLQNNKLRDLSFSITSLKYLRRLFIENNSLSCSCETIQIRDWLTKNYVSIDNPICLYDHRKKVLLSEVKTSEVCLKIQVIHKLEDLMQGDDPLGGSVFQGSGSDPEDDEDLYLTVSPSAPSHSDPVHEEDIFDGSGHSKDDVIYIDESYDDVDEESSITSSTENKITTEHTLKNPTAPIKTEEEEEGSGSGSGDGAILSTIDDDDDNDKHSLFVSEIPTTMEPVTSSSKFSDWSLFDWIVGRNTNEAVTESTPDPKFDDSKDTAEVQVTEEIIIPKANPKLDTEVIGKVPGDKTELTNKSQETDETSENIELGNVKTERNDDNTTTYACLGVLSFLLVLLIICVIVKKRKSDRSRKRQQKRDVENRGTEMRDMNKKLIEQNQAKPKVNGNFETVPLVRNGDKKPTVQPRMIPDSNDIKSTLVSSNGKALEEFLDSPKANEIETYDNISSPKSMSIVYDVPKKDLVTAQLANSFNSSPNDYKVKIIVKENPESVPKTPVLVTRTRSDAGEIILTAVNKNGLNGNSTR